MWDKTVIKQALNKKYALNNEQRLTTNFYGMTLVVLLCIYYVMHATCILVVSPICALKFVAGFPAFVRQQIVQCT